VGRTVVINARNRLCPAVEYIEVSNSRIQPSTLARNIGVTFDQHMSMDKHVTNICKNCFFHLRKIAKIEEYLSTSDIQTLVHAFITSKLDNCNSLLYGLPKFLIDRLQNVLYRVISFCILSCPRDYIKKNRVVRHCSKIFCVCFDVM
jgi:hypothetical protein